MNKFEQDLFHSSVAQDASYKTKDKDRLTFWERSTSKKAISQPLINIMKPAYAVDDEEMGAAPFIKATENDDSRSINSSTEDLKRPRIILFPERPSPSLCWWQPSLLLVVSSLAMTLLELVRPSLCLGFRSTFSDTRKIAPPKSYTRSAATRV